MTQLSRRGILAAGLAGGAAAALGRPAAAQPSPRTSGNRFLEGAFKPVDYEVTEFSLPVTGRIPRDLNGRLLRNGPNAFGIEDPVAHHWLIGDGMVHGVRLREGRAEWYRSRWIRSRSVAEKLGEPVRGTPTDFDYASSINVIGFDGKTLAMQEGTARPQELTDELYTVGPCDFNGTWAGTMSAHTKHDPRTGELHSVSYDESKTYVQYVVVGRSGEVLSTRNIPMGGTLLTHDFALTEKYVVLYDQPIVFDLDAMQHGQKIPWIWDDSRPHRIGIFPRSGGPVTWLPVEPSYISHTLNAYDHGNHVVVDFVAFPAPFDADRLRATGPPRLDRLTIDLARRHVTATRLDDRPQEFPRVSDAAVAQPHRFGYTASTAEFLHAYTGGTAPLPNGISKHDLVHGTTEFHRLPRHAHASEAVFVQRAGGRAEDDGYVLSYVHNPERNAADLIVLAAQDFTGTPLARIHLPHRIPLGLHGSWIAD